LKLLVEHGAKLYLQDGFGRDVMGWAKKHKNSEMIEYINNQAEQNTADINSSMEQNQ
jgi:hypothetical protein